MKIKAEFCGIRMLGHIITDNENNNKRVPGSIDCIVKMLLLETIELPVFDDIRHLSDI